MKCRLKKDIKEFISGTLGLIILISGFLLIFLIIGKLAFMCDIIIYTGVAYSEFEFYIANGALSFLILAVILGVMFLLCRSLIGICKALWFLFKMKFTWKSIKEIFLECE